MFRHLNLKMCIATFILTLGHSTVAFAAEELIVYVKGSTVPVFDCWLSERPVFTFNAEGLSISSPTMETTLPLKLDDIDHVEFKNNESDVLTSVDEMEQTPSTLSFRYVDGNTIVIDGIDTTDIVGLYTIDGKSLSVDSSRMGKRIVMHLNTITRGSYVVKAGSQAFKILKK